MVWESSTVEGLLRISPDSDREAITAAFVPVCCE
jgi:hypothetical protein